MQTRHSVDREGLMSVFSEFGVGRHHRQSCRPVRSPAYKLPDFLFQRDVKRKHCGRLKKKEEVSVFSLS